MKYGFLFLHALLLYVLCLPLKADEHKPTLMYIGIEQQRQPYAWIDKRQKAQGILVERLRQVCKKINAQCEFVAGDFYGLVQQIQTYQLHGVLVIDQFVFPEVDQLSLIAPLCQIEPVIIQSKAQQKRNKPEDFQRTILGVHQGSLLHFYLLDHYSSFAQLRPYETLESGIFDLIVGRIDALVADHAFYQSRVVATGLGAAHRNPSLVATPIMMEDFSGVSMTLAISKSDENLFNHLKQSIQTLSHPLQGCAALVTDGVKTTHD